MHLRDFALSLCAACVLVAACSSPQPVGQAVPVSAAVLYEGARLIPGDGTAPIEQGAFLVEGGRITQIGPLASMTVPAGTARVDLTGKTVMPALIGAHGHVGYQEGVTFLRENYSRESIMNDLSRAAYFGLGTAMTLGIDTPQFVYDIREATAAGTTGVARLKTAGSGIGGPNAGPGNAVYARGVAYEVTTEAEGRAAVQDLAPRKPDLVKIWLDERGGRGQKLSPAVVRAIVDEARMRGLDLIAHVRNHVDAEVAVESGAYALAHLARDLVMSDALISAIVAKGVFVTPTLSMAERNNYSGAVPAWVDEPALIGLLGATLTSDMMAQFRGGFTSRDPKAAAESRRSYEVLSATVTKLNAAGARIVLGCDTGLPDHFWGFAEHRELELLVSAGLTPMQALAAGTSRAAEFLHMADLGTLAPGKVADFLVLDANPLDDIRNTRRIAHVYLSGQRVDREAMKTRWASTGTN